MNNLPNHLKMETTMEQFRKDVKIFNNEILTKIAKFRHLSNKEQDQLLNDLDMKCLYVCMYLKQLQKQFTYERSDTNVAKRYKSDLISNEVSAPTEPHKE